jgi:RHS repeat-associated protein
VTEVAFPNGVTNSWTRDQAGRVTGWRYEKSGTALLERNFTLDAVGRILDAEYAAGPQPVFPATRRLDFAHDAADRITASGVYSGTNVESTAWLYDGAGAVTNGGGRSYVYGARGLLERAWGTNVDFEAGYDALGNRIWERSGGVERRFAVDHSDPFKRPLEETDAAGTVVRRYVWGPDRLLAVEEADGMLRVALTDERGSVAGLTDASGALTDTFVYGPYGEDWGRTGTNALAFRWLGGYGVRHAGGSLYVTRFRAYGADARRFLSADPMGLAGGGNLYAYGAGDPMFFIDPLGLCESSMETRMWGALQLYGGALEALVGGTFGFVTSVSVGGGILGGIVMLHGSDVASAGWQKMLTGRQVDTFTSQLIQSLGLNQGYANILDNLLSAAGIMGIGSLLKAGSSIVQTSGMPAENATQTSVNDKLARYLLNPEHPVGGSKAIWFEEALGFTKANADDLAKQLTFDPTKAVQTAVTEYGTKYNQVIDVVGANGRTIPVKVAWIRNNDGVVKLVTVVPGN